MCARYVCRVQYVTVCIVCVPFAVCKCQEKRSYFSILRISFFLTSSTTACQITFGLFVMFFKTESDAVQINIKLLYTRDDLRHLILPLSPLECRVIGMDHMSTFKRKRKEIFMVYLFFFFERAYLPYFKNQFVSNKWSFRK